MIFLIDELIELSIFNFWKFISIFLKYFSIIISQEFDIYRIFSILISFYMIFIEIYGSIFYISSTYNLFSVGYFLIISSKLLRESNFFLLATKIFGDFWSRGFSSRNDLFISLAICVLIHWRI